MKRLLLPLMVVCGLVGCSQPPPKPLDTDAEKKLKADIDKARQQEGSAPKP